MIIDPYRYVVTPTVYSTWNPADKGASVVLSGGDTVATLTAALGSVRGFGKSNATGSWYFEVTIGGVDERQLVGIGVAGATLTNYPGVDINGIGYYGFNGDIFVNGSTGVSNSTFGVGDVIGVLMNGASLTFYKNGVLQANGRTIGTDTWFPMWGPGWSNPGDRIGTLNTGGSAFVALPSGASAWG